MSMRDRSVDNGASGTAKYTRHLLDQLGCKQVLSLEIQRLQNENIELRKHLLAAKMSQRETEQRLIDFHHLRDVKNMPSSYTINLTEQYHRFSCIIAGIEYRNGRGGTTNVLIMGEDADHRMIYIIDERGFIEFNVVIGDRVEITGLLEPISLYWPHNKWERIICLPITSIEKLES